MTPLADTVRETIARRDLLPSGGPLLLMVSGGGDSVALLGLAAEGVLGERPLRVLHVNHVLRGADSDEDEAFVREACTRLGIELRLVRYDVMAYAAENGLNLEDAARRVRYRFADEELEAWCRNEALPLHHARVAIAHSLDDRIETFFTRAVCGSGTGGLSSIAPARGRIVRPLIDCERAAIRAHLAERGEAWCEDASNADTTRQRALVRAAILPAAEQLNPAFRTSLARTMDLLADDDALLSGMAEAFARDFARVGDGHVEFEREFMRTLDRTMARRTVRSALAKAFPEASRLEAHHIEVLVDGLVDDTFGHHLPGGLRARTEYGSMVVSRGTAEVPRVAPSLLPVPGNAELGFSGRVAAVDAPVDDIIGSADSVVIDAGRVCGELTIDSVRPGDRMRPLGMQGTRKLSDLLVDEKVPRHVREAVPVVRDGEHIVWLAGIRMSEDYRVTERTQRAVRLSWFRGSFAEDRRFLAKETE